MSTNNEHWSERRRLLEGVCKEFGGRMNIDLADELDRLREEEDDEDLEDEGRYCGDCGSLLALIDIDGGRCTNCGSMITPLVKRKLSAEAHGDGLLDDLVHDTASQIASNVNNCGFKEQVRFLKENGWTEEQILSEVE